MIETAERRNVIQELAFAATTYSAVFRSFGLHRSKVASGTTTVLSFGRFEELPVRC